MNDSGAARVSAGAISARIDRLPATRTIWTIIVLLGFGMFFELYDLLFSAYVAPSLVKSGVLTATTAGLFGTTGVASFIAALFTGLFIGTILCGFLADRFGRRAIFTWSLLWYSAANIMVALQSDAAGLNFWRLVSGIGLGVEMVTIGAYLSELAPKAIRGRAFAVNQAIGFICVPVISFLAYMLVPTAPLGLEGWRWVVLIGALAAPVVVYLRLGLPESPRWLAKHGRLEEADRVLSGIEAKVEAEYGRPLPPPGPEEPVVAGEPLRRSLGPRRARPRDPDERLQHLSDDRILRLQQLGALAPGQAGDHGLDQPRLYDGDRACGAARTAARILPRRPARAQMDHRRVGGQPFSSAASFSGRRAIRRSSSPWASALTLAANIMSFSFHAYQQELFPTGIRARAAGFVYSWSRLSVIFSSFIIAFILNASGAFGVFVFIAAAMGVVMATIGIFGPRTTNLALEEIAR